MEAKSNEFSIISVEYKRPRLSKKDIDSDLMVKEGCQITFMKFNENKHRIQIDVTSTATILGKVSKKEEIMINLKTRSEYDVDQEPDVNDLKPFITDAVIATRKTLKKITVTMNIKPIDLVDNPIF